MAEKRIDLEFSKNWKRFWISTDDVRDLKKRLKVGDIVEVILEREVEINDKICTRKRIVKARVVEKHNHVCMVSAGKKIHTIQYKDILLCQVQKITNPEVTKNV